MYGFIRIGESTYQMQEVGTREMDELLKTGDSMEWPLRFDKKRRIYPPLRDGWEPFFQEKNPKDK
jgi:hypothetical protein